MIRDVVLLDQLEERRPGRVPQHGVRRRADQAWTAGIQVCQFQSFVTERLGLASANRTREALEAAQACVKLLLGVERYPRGAARLTSILDTAPIALARAVSRESHSSS